MSMDYNQYRLKYLKEKQNIREENEAYKEAFYKLSNEEKIIIIKVERELIQVDKMDRPKKYKIMLEQMKKEEIKSRCSYLPRIAGLVARIAASVSLENDPRGVKN